MNLDETKVKKMVGYTMSEEEMQIRKSQLEDGTLTKIGRGEPVSINQALAAVAYISTQPKKLSWKERLVRWWSRDKK